MTSQTDTFAEDRPESEASPVTALPYASPAGFGSLQNYVNIVSFFLVHPIYLASLQASVNELCEATERVNV